MVGRSVVRGLVAAGLALAAPLPAVAATAEEAVAYAFMGLADGARLVRATTTMAWTEASASPAVFDGKAEIGGRPVAIRFTVKAAAPCVYEVLLEGPMVPGGGSTLYARIDLADVDTVTIAGDALHVEFGGGGFCETGQRNRDCMVLNRSDLFGFVDAARHADLLAYIQSAVCPADAKPHQPLH